MCWVHTFDASLSDASYFTLRGAPRLFASAEFVGWALWFIGHRSQLGWDETYGYIKNR